MKIIVIGAGAWGTALAVQTAARHSVTLLARDAAQVARMQAARENTQYLRGIALPEQLALHAQTAEAPLPSHLSDADLIVIATPLRALHQWLGALRHSAVPLVWLCKGFDENGLLAHEISARVAPELIANQTDSTAASPGYGVLSGPSFAQEVARGQPTAIVAASESQALRHLLVQAFHSPALRVYTSDDVVGVEVGGAVKNVLAIATGLCDGLHLGLNARAALITRGLAEMTRLGVALGARAETFMGLAGLGDLVLTATGDLSRNRQIGLLLAQGRSLQDALQSLGHVAEGVTTAHTVLKRAQQLGIDMPITQCVVALLDGQLAPQQAVAQLMGREATNE
jgi:glycerol-3-phosphate dehydrogenase (NAD(P)+)